MTYISDVDVEYLALGKNLGGAGSIGLSIKTLGVGEIPVTTETSPDGTGESISPTYLSGGLTYSRMISDRIAAGFSATLLHESMGDVEATNIAFTAGVTYTRLGGIEGLSVAVVIRNIGPPMTYGGEGLKRTAENEGDDRPPSTYMIEAASADLPSSVEVGLGYAAALDESFVVQTSGLFQNNNFSNDEYKVGVELGYLKRFFLRGGYLFQGGEGEEYIYGVTAGVGAGLDLGGSDLTLDYAYRQVTFFTGNHVIALHLAFD
jgi:hypothetical protein